MRLTPSSQSWASLHLGLVLSFGLALASDISASTTTSNSPVPTTLTDSLLACARTTSCGKAAKEWVECLGKWNNGEIEVLKPATGPGSTEPDSALRSCLCQNGDTKPSYPSWSHDLYVCSACVDLAVGGDGLTITGELFALTGVPEEPGTPSGFCPGLITYDQLVAQAHALQLLNNFPLVLPDAVLVTNWSANDSMKASTPTSNVETGCGGSSTSSASFTTASILTTSFVVGCNQDNCLRQAIQSSAPVSNFCVTYTKGANTVSTDLPAIVSQCNSIPADISSACSCLEGMQVQTIQNRGSCNEDNCYRQFIRNSEPAASFCETYTTATSTCSENLPAIVSQCQSDPTRVSSACSCLAGRVTLTAATNGLVSSTHSNYAVSVTPTTAVAKTDMTLSQSSKSMSVALSSQTHVSPLQTSISSTLMAAGPQYGSSRTFTSGSITGASTQVSIPISKISTTSASPSAPFIVDDSPWITLPPSNATKACVATDCCKRAALVFNECINLTGYGDNTQDWDCFCQTNFDTWKSAVGECTTCIANALPLSSRQGLLNTDLPIAVATLMDDFCNVTDITLKATSDWRLVQIGLAVTEYWESPILFFNMTLLEKAIYSPFSAGVLVPPTSTTTPNGGKVTTFTTQWITVTSTKPKSTTVISTKSIVSGSSKPGIASSKASSSTSNTLLASTSKVATPSSNPSPPVTSTSSQLEISTEVTSPTTKDIVTAPITTAAVSTSTTKASPPVAVQSTAAAQKCSTYTSCMAARNIFSNCINMGTTEDNEPTWTCLCQNNIAQYNYNMQNCLTCISNALPSRNISQALYEPSTLVDTVLTDYFNDIYCKAYGDTIYSTNKNTTTSFLVNEGWDLTYGFKSPILLYNMTLLAKPPTDTVPVERIWFLTKSATTTATAVPSSATGLTPSPNGTWSSLPASPEMLGCLQSNGCVNAKNIFDVCSSYIDGENKWRCFCDINFALYNSTLTSCISCIDSALPPGNKSPNYLRADLNHWAVEYAMQQQYCQYPNQASVKSPFPSINQLLVLGNDISYFYEASILLFNLTIVTKPLSLLSF